MSTFEKTINKGYKLTSQYELFGCTSYEIMSDKSSFPIFKFNDSLLESCFYYVPDGKLGHFLDCKSSGYALLAYLTEIALGIKRLPWAKDRILDAYFGDYRKDLEWLSKELSAQRINDLLDDVKRLYLHTQNQLRMKGLTHVKLVRHICDRNNNLSSSFEGYTSTIAGLKTCSEAIGNDSVEFEMDLINSFTCSLGSYPQLQYVTIYQEIPIEDVLYCSAFLNKNEGGEWHIINRNPSGVVKVKLDDITFSDNVSVKRYSKEKSQKILDRSTPYAIRGIHYQDYPLLNLGYREGLIKKIARWVFNHAR